MKNTIRTLIFLTSFFAFFAIFKFVGLDLLNVPEKYIIIAGLVSYIVAVGVQALLRNIYIITRLKKQAILFSLPVKAFSMRDRLNMHTLPLIVTVLPWIYKRPALGDALFTIVILAIYIAFAEVIQRFGEKTLKINFFSKGIAISGYDFRPDFNLPFQTENAPGYYDFSRIIYFKADENNISITQRLDFSQINVEASEENLARIAAILIEKGVVPE